MIETARYSAPQLMALRRFAIAITGLTVVGHLVLGFESSYAQPVVAVATAYGMQLLFDFVDARARNRVPRFAGGLAPLINSLLSAHITALAVAMLLYFNERLSLVVFATAVAIASKVVFRAPVENGTRHVFNPSNFGISVTLLLFPDRVGLAPPWQFTENLPALIDWGLVLFIFTLGTFIHIRFTRRLPLIAAWFVGFILQAVFRNVWFSTSLFASLAPMTGVAFALFTFYMAPDPATTPERLTRQIAFGGGIALIYGVLMALHVVFALFYALTIVCGLRGGRTVSYRCQSGERVEAFSRARAVDGTLNQRARALTMPGLKCMILARRVFRADPAPLRLS